MDTTDGLLTRSSLLARLSDARDTASWSTFVAMYTPLVYRYARRKGLQDADAADLTQETLVEVARCIHEFDYSRERGRFRDWLGTLTRRRLARFYERRNRSPSAAGNQEDSDGTRAGVSPIDAEWSDEWNVQILRTALGRARQHFAPTTWRAFERVWLDGQTARDVASELQMPVEAVYVAKSRVLKRLEAEVRDLADDMP